MMWFFTGIFILLLFIVYRLIQVSISGVKMQNRELLQEVDKLNNQLDLLTEKELKALRDADIASTSKRKLLSMMSHELRTPLNGVTGMATLLSATELNTEQREYTNTILECSKNLLANVNEILINDMLDLSKIDSESLELNKKNFDLRNCIEEVLDMFAGKAAISGLEIIYQIEPAVPAQITGDYKRLQQIIINLVDNAITNTRTGEIYIETFLKSDTRGEQLEIGFNLRDTGEGISEEKLQQLFKPVLPTDYSTKTREIGKGFGLLICRRLVEKMGGQLSVQSSLGIGTCFTFSIMSIASQQIVPDFINNKMIGFEGRQILIVDDNLTLCKVLSNQLDQWKLLPLVAHSGKQALEILTQISVDLVVIDFGMPEINGLQLAQMIRSLYGQIPIILLNQVNNESCKEYAEIFNAIINKPVRYHSLFDGILTTFRNSGKIGSANGTLRDRASDFSALYPLRILAAEDNPVNQKWIKKVLNKIGYECEIAENGKVVLEKVSHDHYDLILMDVQMPEMDGLETTRMIRVCLEMQPVIIAMTANVLQGDREECMQSGMNDYISKPVELTELLAMLEKWAISIKEKKESIKNIRLV